MKVLAPIIATIAAILFGGYYWRRNLSHPKRPWYRRREKQ